LLGAVIGGRNRRVQEEHEIRGCMLVEMLGEAFVRRVASRALGLVPVGYWDRDLLTGSFIW
jgi:hypothetical protein